MKAMLAKIVDKDIVQEIVRDMVFVTMANVPACQDGVVKLVMLVNAHLIIQLLFVLVTVIVKMVNVNAMIVLLDLIVGLMHVQWVVFMVNVLTKENVYVIMVLEVS